MAITVEDFHQAWVVQVIRAENAEREVKALQARNAELEKELVVLKNG